MTSDREIKKILVVDDDEPVRRILETALSDAGFACASVADAAQAVAALANDPVDLVVSDVKMPQMDGVELMKTLRATHPSLEFIIMTGLTSDYSYGDIIKAGASDYMTKPFELSELMARIDRVDREKRIMRELKAVNHRLAEAIEEANRMAKKAETASMAKSDFLAGMSHEIRTPLNAIVGFTDILIDTHLDKDQHDYVKTIKVSSEALLALINDVLDASKIEAGKMEIDMIDFDPEVLCYDVCDLIRPQVEGKPVEIRCVMGDQVPSKIKGDPFRFRQVLLNLMSNATKFTNQGVVELRLDIEEEAEDSIKLITSVRDTGIGVPPDKLDLIFEPYRQANGAMAREYGGTGLGLSICKNIVALMDGEIWAESVPGKGSCFWFTAVMLPAGSGRGKRSPTVDLGGRRVLMVGPNYTNMRILEKALTAEGMEVAVVFNLERLPGDLETAAEKGHPFDVCIIDTDQHGRAGYELAKTIRSASAPAAATVLIAMASPFPGSARECEDAGFDGFIAKPINRRRLYEMLRKLLGSDDDRADREGDHPIMTQYSVREDMKSSVGILLAEDNPVNQQLVKVLLEKAGYRVDVAQNGIEVVDLYTKNPHAYDLILMDVQMPVKDGIAAAMEIREWEARGAAVPEGPSPVPIVAVTANVKDGDQQHCLNAGMNDYIAKPIKREVVYKVIEKWVMN